MCLLAKLGLVDELHSIAYSTCGHNPSETISNRSAVYADLPNASHA